MLNSKRCTASTHVQATIWLAANARVGNLNRLIHLARSIGCRVLEKPLISLACVEYTRINRVVCSGKLVVAQARSVSIGRLHSVVYSARLADRHQVIGCTVHNPERHLVQVCQLGRLTCRTTAERHCSSSLLRIGSSKIERTITSEAHTQHIDTRCIDIVVVSNPIHQAHHSVWTPPIIHLHLRCNNDCVDFAACSQSVQSTILTHLVQIGATEATTVQEYNDRQRFRSFLIAVLLSLVTMILVATRHIEPEVIAVRSRIFNSKELLRSRCQRTQQKEQGK